MSEVKITKLTPHNIRALTETLSDEQATRVRLTATTAVFDMSATEAATMVSYLQSQAALDYGATGHPYKSLTAVRRKLEALEVAVEASPSPAVPSSPGSAEPPKVLSDLLRLDSDG
ncbi:hypothetical protein [Amycolatopsis sp. NPDC059021]|uniref:hypothetical protein n=1 Tax=Amycolatopsis sp. NPDC059021 TaxID=3346704 RepID=UPI00366CC604